MKKKPKLQLNMFFYGGDDSFLYVIKIGRLVWPKKNNCGKNETIQFKQNELVASPKILHETTL